MKLSVEKPNYLIDKTLTSLLVFVFATGGATSSRYKTDWCWKSGGAICWKTMWTKMAKFSRNWL